jgi:CRP/FNR family transcriptional regulator
MITDKPEAIEGSRQRSPKPPPNVEAETPRRPLDILRDSMFFERLDPDSMAILAASASLRTYKAGEMMHNRGDRVKGIYMVVKGQVDVFLTNSSGRERILTQVGDGFLLGVSSMMLGDDYPCWLRASKNTEALFFPTASIRSMVADNPVILTLMNTMARRLHFFWELIESSGERLMPRLASFLLGLPSNNDVVKLPMTKSQLAMRLGTTPESLSRAFSRLKGAGIINPDGRGLIITDRVRLASIVTDGELTI